MGQKRGRDEMEGKTSTQGSTSTSPSMPMFEHFRAELDEHHDRRERVIKASRDITAASKKIIFALQRCRAVKQPTPSHVQKEMAKFRPTIANGFSGVANDLQGLNSYRYARQISGGCQEWMEAASFEHYLVTGSLLGFDDAVERLRLLGVATHSALDDDGGSAGDGALHGAGNVEDARTSIQSVSLTHEDYLLGIYDMTGELMRFAITTMATTGQVPISSGESGAETKDRNAMEVMDDEDRGPSTVGSERNVLTDMRDLRAQLEKLEVGTGFFARDVEKKMEVMRQSVEKVERALYGLVVRGAERPKGWMPEANDGGGGRGVEVEG